MAVTEQDIRDAIPGGESIPSGAITQKLNQAPLYMEKYGVTVSNPDYDTLHTLYTVHLLYMSGHAKELSSFSIDGHSQSFTNKNTLGAGITPALLEFEELLGATGNQLIIVP